MKYLPSDVACNKQFPSPLVNSGYNLGQGNFLLTHQLRRSKKRYFFKALLNKRCYWFLPMSPLLVYQQDYP